MGDKKTFGSFEIDAEELAKIEREHGFTEIKSSEKPEKKKENSKEENLEKRMIDEEIRQEMPPEEVTLLYLVDSAMNTINKEIGKRELELKCTPEAATLALFNALRSSRFKRDTEGGYQVPRMDLCMTTEKMLGEKDAYPLINWFQRKHGYDNGFIMFPVKHFREAGEEQARKEDEKKKEETAAEISTQIIKDTKSNINRGVTVTQLNYVYDWLEKFGIEPNTCVKGTSTLAYNMCKNLAKELSLYSMKNQDGIIDRKELTEKVATENMYNGMRDTIKSVRKIFEEEQDKAKAAERVKNEIDFDKRLQAKLELEKREKDVSTIINYFLRNSTFKEADKEKGIGLMIDDDKFRDVFGFAEKRRKMYLDDEIAKRAVDTAVPQTPAVQGTLAKAEKPKKLGKLIYRTVLGALLLGETIGASLYYTNPAIKKKVDRWIDSKISDTADYAALSYDTFIKPEITDDKEIIEGLKGAVKYRYKQYLKTGK